MIFDFLSTYPIFNFKGVCLSISIFVEKLEAVFESKVGGNEGEFPMD